MTPTIHASSRIQLFPQMKMFRRTAKFINQPSLMPHLYKDLDDDRHTAVEKQTVSTKSTRHVAMSHPQPTPHSYNLQPHNRNFVHVTESKMKLELTCKILSLMHMYMSIHICIASPMTINMILY